MLLSSLVIYFIAPNRRISYLRLREQLCEVASQIESEILSNDGSTVIICVVLDVILKWLCEDIAVLLMQ